MMARNVRDQMVDSAVILLAKYGPDGTSFTEVLTASGAPRGSIYHHFPGGKDELIAAAIEVAGARAVTLLSSFSGRGPVEIVDGFFAMWRAVLERSQFSAGCAVLAVTVAGSHGGSADSGVLLRAAAQVFRSWQAELASVLAAGGVPAASAGSFALLLIAASEGAVALSRAEQSYAPFDTVHRELRDQAARW
ncbi:MAG: TetR/AcrR family transcriptional regulator [Streptosporangiaceae bacterium]|jgi:TetR/AcrR family transcriptional repressor of lmrAB and yxaGH operons